MKLKIIKYIPLVLLILSLNGCNSQNKCIEIYNNYVDSYVEEKSEEALNYLNKAIECDPNNDEYKFDMVKFYIDQRDLDNAVKYVDNLENDNTRNLLKGALFLKKNSRDGARLLFSKVFSNLNKENNNAYDEYNLIVLGYYLEGRDYANRKIETFEQKFTSDYETEIINNLKGMMIEKSAEDIILDLFNLNDY